MLGEATFPYLECAAGADHSRLLCISHTVSANRLSLCQLVVWL